MPYEVIPKDDYVLIRHFGNLTMTEIEAARPEVLEAVKIHSVYKVVVDVTGATNEFQPADSRRIALGNADVSPPRPAAAVVGRPDQLGHLGLMESLSVSRGLPIKTFTDMQSALDWLAE